MSKTQRFRFSAAVALSATFLLGTVVGSLATSEVSAELAPQVVPPAYLIAASEVVSDPSVLAAYSEAATPSAIRAGMEPLARTQEVHVLEGEWPFEDRIILVERFTSVQALLDFWYSPEYQEAKKLREGLLDIDFIIAVEGAGP